MINLTSLYQYLFHITPPTGANLDTRSPAQQVKDLFFEETVSSAAPVIWTTKDRSTWRTYPVQDQYQKFDCVAETMKKILGVWYEAKTGQFIDFSSTDLYKRRTEKAGMAGIEAFELVRTQGLTLEALVPSTAKNDAQVDATVIEQYKRDVGAVFKISNYLQIRNFNIDTIASIIQTTQKAVMVWFFFEATEWDPFQPAVLYPGLQVSDQDALRHSVAAVDYTLWNGQKALIIEDSAHFGGLSQRVVTEDFFNKRIFFAAYPMGFVFDSQIANVPGPLVTPPPHHQFTKSLQFSPTFASDPADPDVMALQNILKYEGFFPTNVESTGRYGSITAKGVLQWQSKHQIYPQSQIDAGMGHTIGPMDITILNQLYG